MRSTLLVVFLCSIYQTHGAIQCGKRNISTHLDNAQAYENIWPWHAAIYHKKEGSFKLACVGSIINSNSIITTAHCLHDENGLISTDRVSVHVGRTELNQTSDRVHVHTVSELIVHPNYHRYAMPNDIALIKLAKNITMMDHIQPVCLWSVDKGLTQDWVLENRGILAGFGSTEPAVLSNHLREVDVRVVDSWTCIESDREIYGRHLTRNMLCGKATVCLGDGGAGVMFAKDGIWYIRGVLSFVPSIDGQLCDNSKYAVFTDVARYHNWISRSVDLTYVK